MEEEGVKLRHKEGYGEGVWVLMDFGEVIVHVFHEEARRFYALERLWGDAPKRHYLK
jgi:ribosome-associated protein